MSQHPDSPTILAEEYRNIFEAASDGLVIYDLELDLVVEANPAACQMHGYSRQEFIGLGLGIFMDIEGKTLLREQIQTAGSGGAFEALVVHTRKDGLQFYMEERMSVIVFCGRPCLLSVMRDVSQRIQTEKILSQQIEDQMREQATLLAISHTLASTLEIQPGMILDQVREIIECTHCALFALEESALVTLATRGTPQLEGSEPFHIHLQGDETLAALFNGHNSIRIADIWSDDVHAQFLRTLLSDTAAILLKGMSSWMWVPLAVKGRIIGGVGVAHEKRNFFTSHHADLALSVANQAAITMVNAELYKDAQKLGILEERQNLARNLHDAINQSLFSAGLIAEVLPRLWEREPEEARRSLEDLRRLTRGALAEMRSLLVELRPSAIIDTELGDLLQLLGNAFTGRTNIPVVVTVTGDGTLPAETQIVLYRICQEALNNIAKHAKASQVKINVLLESGMFELHIRDNGRGFNPADQPPSGHYGLSMMRERAESVGATLLVTSQMGQGTEIAIRWTIIPKKETE
jgi:PAS domain S-box-containing protein